MSESDNQQACLLARVNFPLYCIKAITERHILVGGGGGISKTGISNPFEIYELSFDPISNMARATLVTHFDVGDHAIMNMCFIPLSKYSFEITCGGMQGICHVYDMKFTFKNGYIDFSHGTNILQQSNNCLRRRNFSLSSQHSSEDIEENIEEVNEKIKEDLNKKTSLSKSDNHNQQGDDIKKDNNIPDYQFDFELKNSFQTDFHLNEPYQKLIKYSARNNMVFSGGADGWIRFWTLPNYNLFKEIKAHDNEIDDIDIHPNGKHLVSVSRDCKCYIWNVSTGKLLTTLNHDQVIPRPSNNKQKLPNQAEPKYNPRLCRYSIVEGDENNSRLFVTLNTQSKLDSYICKWFIKNDQYLIEKIVATGDVPIFAMAISNDGRFLAIGKQTGDVDVYIAFSLQRCYHFVQAHNIFVTGIEFLSTSPATLELVGGNTEISLVSISVDNRIVLHKIPRRATLGFLGSFLSFVVFILVIYFVMNYFDL